MILIGQIQDFSKTIKLNPNYAAAYNNLGVAYHKKGDFDKAIQNYSNVIKLQPDDAEGYVKARHCLP